MFNYWIGPGRIDVAFLAAAQVDRFDNLNSTVIGDYDKPKTKLHPGVEIETVREAIGWDLAVAAAPTTTEQPTSDELRVRR
jgi:acyl CoA:acetate/3-ketoacid CoA transferase beta subunit